jgi:uncharacterized protein (UPF0276 family)
VKYSINYSQAAAALHRAGEIKVDLFKCPAWPEAIKAALDAHNVYVHFPLTVGTGVGDAINIESGQPADWRKIEELLAETNTPFVDLHLGPAIDAYPEIPAESMEPAHIDLIRENLIKDVKSVVERFGPDRVIVENVHSGHGHHPRPVYLPEVINSVVEETGCGFLFDLSHAQLAADRLGVDIRDYIRGLPRGAIREIHVTGIHRFEGRWVEIAQKAGFDQAIIDQYRGQLVDHLPMTEPDWAFLSWSISQIREGIWGKPWVITFEYGGIGGMFAPMTDGEVIRRQVPRMVEMIKRA